MPHTSRLSTASTLATCLAIIGIGLIQTPSVNAGPNGAGCQDAGSVSLDSAEIQTDSIAEFTQSMKRSPGFFDMFWDETSGRIFLEVRTGEEFLYAYAMSTGLGSNPVGLDRGKLGSQKVVRFVRVGPKVMMLQDNLRFRAYSPDADERAAVAQSFAQSVVWGTTVVAETGERILVDATSLLMTDANGVVGTLKRTNQGDFSLDQTRSAVYMPSCKSFPDNTELEAMLTFTGKEPGRHVQQTTPTPQSVTVRQRHSFVRLPKLNFRPRIYDVRSPSMKLTFADYATPIDQPLQKRWILRHRLEKKNPSQAISEPVEPIIYYVDRGAPKIIRDALIEGASWWAEAFESAGFKNAFEVRVLPKGGDPLDVRFNMIQWVHRSTRGWSYGGSVIDPRTGEILKGHVTLGSLRVRQDHLLLTAVTGGEAPENGCYGIVGVSEDATLAELGLGAEPMDVALARIRQLSAHEVGHTLGFVHNFAASTYDDRASVMDYPAPRVRVTPEGQLDLSDAYGVGIGTWDKVAVQFAYSQFSPENEATKLDEILESAGAKGMLFLSDSDARSPGAAHPMANLWDNGTDPLAELKHVMNVRKIALERFDPARLPVETNSADVEQYLVPLYLHHRFQLQAAGKLIGGVSYNYGRARDADDLKPVSAKIQRAAIRELIETISPESLTVSENVLKRIGVKPYSAIRDQETFARKTDRVFDPMTMAQVAIDLVLNELLQHERLNRLAQQAATLKLSPKIVVRELITQSWEWADQSNSGHAQVARLVRSRILRKLMELADNQSTTDDVRSAALDGIWQMSSRVSVASKDNAEEASFRRLIKREIGLFLKRPYAVMPPSTSVESPPGSPIGQ